MRLVFLMLICYLNITYLLFDICYLIFTYEFNSQAKHRLFCSHLHRFCFWRHQHLPVYQGRDLHSRGIWAHQGYHDHGEFLLWIRQLWYDRCYLQILSLLYRQFARRGKRSLRALPPDGVYWIRFIDPGWLCI